VGHTLSNQDAVLKDYYTDDKMKEMSYGENPLYAFIRKERGQMAGGRRYVQPVEFGHPGGGNATYGMAMTDGTTSQYEDFLISRKKQYQRIIVDHELLFATSGQKESFRKALDEFDRGLKGLGEKIGRRMYRTQGGSLGRLDGSSVTSTTINFEEKSTAFNVHKGMKLQFAAADGTGSLRDSGDFVTVVSVDIENGTAVVDATLDAQINGVGTTDYIFQRGDFNECIAGLEGWLPVADRSTQLSTSFNSVDRSVAPDRLGGIYMDGTGMGGLDEVIIKLIGKVSKHGGTTSHIFANPESLTDLELLSNSKMRIVSELNSKVVGSNGDVLVGFSGYKAIVGGRTVKVYADRNCPGDRLYALQLNTWTLWHTGELINWLGESYTGNKMQPAQNEDAAEARLGAYMNLGCSAPGWNGVAKINAPT
jgi:hypothetical protein